MNGQQHLARRFDGATKHSNPGFAVSVRFFKGQPGRSSRSLRNRPGTNNEAEYCALMAVLDAAVTAQVQNLIVYGDSQLVIAQVNGEWLINAPGLVHFCKTVLELKALIPNVSLRWIPREENGEADALSKRAIGIAAPEPLDRTVWMKITEIGKPFCLSGGAGQRMDAAKLREGGKPTQLAPGEKSARSG
ncbi:MAG: ribonuclease HI family protein [Betaproteobacteria bacterium]|nr:ribonuclease HI family protein [Candidatus Dechloromonas phosphorivorans]